MPYFLALAADFDGTLALRGHVDAATCKGLAELRRTGRRLILVTGRRLPDLMGCFPEVGLFDMVVAENGALLYTPGTQSERLLAPPPPTEFVRRLQALNIAPLEIGRCIVGTWQPHEIAVLNLIRELGLELQIIFNKGAVMVLPTGINKATGLQAALDALELSSINVSGVGDAENDHAFLKACGHSAAVANSLSTLKAGVDTVLRGDHGAGVVELIDLLMNRDIALASVARHGLLIGCDRSGREIYMEPDSGSLLAAGHSGSGKSAFATALTERMVARGFEFCIIDPEGDYTELKNAICVGRPGLPPSLSETIELLRETRLNLVVNTQALPLEHRRAFFAALLRETAQLRSRTGRPHWLVVDEAHQVLPASATAPQILREHLPRAIFLTVYTHALCRDVLGLVEQVIAFGATPAQVFADLHKIVPTQAAMPLAMSPGEACYWRKGQTKVPLPVRVICPAQKHVRHAGKYAEGDLGAERSFYFCDADGQAVVSARNLFVFMDEGEEVDLAIWRRHLRAGDYSRWIRDVIKDDDLAAAVSAIEADPVEDVRESQQRVRRAILSRYGAPI